MKTCWYILLALAIGTYPCVQATTQDTAEDLQQRGIGRLDQVREQFRKSGLQPQHMSQLSEAAAELTLSYQKFAAQSNSAQAAWSLTKLGDCERLQALFARLSAGDSNRKDTSSAEALARSAIDHYKQAAALALKTQADWYLVEALTGLALLYQTQYHDYGTANAHITEALTAATRCARQCLPDALEAKVRVEVGRGELIAAASHVNGLISLVERASEPYLKYSAYMDRSDVYHQMADGCSDSFHKSTEICYRLFDLEVADLGRARNIAEQAGYFFFRNAAQAEIENAKTLRDMTQMYNSHDKIPPGTFDPKSPDDVGASEVIVPGGIPRSFREQIRALRQSAGPGLPGALQIYLQAEIDDMEGRSDQAMQGYLRAVHTIEDDRQKVSEDRARSSFLDDKVDFYDAPIITLLRAKRYAEAFELLENTRARVTSDLLNMKTTGLSKAADRKLFAALALKKAEITALQSRFFNGIFSPPSSEPGDAEAVAQNQVQLAELEQRYEQMLARPERATRSVSVSRSASLADLQAALATDSANLLYYYVRDWAVILIHISPNAVHVRNIFLPRYELKAKVTALLDSMRKQNAAFRDDLSRELFLFLLQPATRSLNSNRIIIIPQGDLESLPFQALQDPSDGTFAGEHFQITYAPSASILLQLRRQRSLAGATVLAAADPSLPGAPEEVTTITRQYPERPKVIKDTLIQKAELLTLAPSYGIVHLAVHGEFDGEEPLLSHLKLGAAPGATGDLTAAEMFGMPLENARLVTLSACETGRVRTTRANEIQGIQQALLFAGAQSLLVSAWKVESESTSLWMQAFYREAKTRTLAEAQQAAIRALRANPRFNHPHYWAPFLLIAR